MAMGQREECYWYFPIRMKLETRVFWGLCLTYPNFELPDVHSKDDLFYFMKL
jgi:hypothetical protein